MALSGLVYGFSHYFITFLIAEVLYGLGETFISGAGEAWTVDEMLAGAVGEVLAGVLMGVIAVAFGIRWTFLISAGLIFLLFLGYRGLFDQTQTQLVEGS